jgi:hypothetical protein
MILDAPNTAGVPGGDAQYFALRLRSDNTPEMHDPFRDDDPISTNVCPPLVPQLGEQLVADHMVSLLGAGRADRHELRWINAPAGARAEDGK